MSMPFSQSRRLSLKTSLAVGVLLLIAGSWFFSAKANTSAKLTPSVRPAVAQTALAPSTDKQEVTVYATRTGSKYHRSGCRYLRKSQIPMSLDSAKQRYGACSVCNPPR